MNAAKLDPMAVDGDDGSDTPWRIVFAVSGVALLILGGLAFGHMAAAKMVSTFIIGSIMVVGALLQFGHALSLRHTGGIALWTLGGLFYLLAGIAVLLEPIAGERLLSLLLAIALIASGVARLVLGIQHAANMITLSGTATILVGTVIGMDWPQNSLWPIAALIGVDLVAQGIGLVSTSLSARLAAIVEVYDDDEVESA
jgi:uncharacterized membrane protein HdeD (DUF308 family)